MPLEASIRRNVPLAAALMALACAYFTVDTSYANERPPHRAYAGAPLPREQVAVILVQVNPNIAHMETLAVHAIDAKEVPPGSGYALLPGPHSLEVVGRTSGTLSLFGLLGTDVAATLQVEASAGSLLGLRVARSAYKVEFVDLNQGSLLLASARLEAAGSP